MPDINDPEVAAAKKAGEAARNDPDSYHALQNAVMWPLLPSAATDEAFQDAAFEVLRTQAGQVVLNTLITRFILADPDVEITAERAIGRQDVAKFLFYQYNIGLDRRANPAKYGEAAAWKPSQ